MVKSLKCLVKPGVIRAFGKLAAEQVTEWLIRYSGHIS
jgi:hypothetical protein